MANLQDDAQGQTKARHKRRSIRWVGDSRYRRNTALTMLSLVLASGLMVLVINVGALLKYPQIVSEGADAGISLVTLIVISSAVSLLVILLFSLFVIVVYSHKIAGPMYRVEKVLESLIKGDLNIPIVFRKDDEFQNIGHALNKLREKMRDASPPDPK